MMVFSEMDAIRYENEHLRKVISNLTNQIDEDKTSIRNLTLTLENEVFKTEIERERAEKEIALTASLKKSLYNQDELERDISRLKAELCSLKERLVKHKQKEEEKKDDGLGHLGKEVNY